jgi:hypothetical protein
VLPDLEAANHIFLLVCIALCNMSPYSPFAYRNLTEEPPPPFPRSKSLKQKKLNAFLFSLPPPIPSELKKDTVDMADTADNDTATIDDAADNDAYDDIENDAENYNPAVNEFTEEGHYIRSVVRDNELTKLVCEVVPIDNTPSPPPAKLQKGRHLFNINKYYTKPAPFGLENKTVPDLLKLQRLGVENRQLFIAAQVYAYDFLLHLSERQLKKRQ